jgi:uncharacterized protein (TIGR00725 family)
MKRGFTILPARIISVIGGADSTPDVLEIAQAIGSEIARRGAVLACGGLGGVMEAACRGAKNAGGTTLGILPSDSKQDANKFVDYAIPTGLGYARNFLVAKTGDAVIAIGGSAGTLSEIAISWFSDKPVVAMKNSGGWAARMAGQRIDERRDDIVHSASTAEEAVEIIFRELDWK